MMDGAVDRAVERLQRGDDEHDAPAGHEDLAHRGERPAVVLDVLEDVRAHDGVEGLPRDAVVGRAARGRATHLDVRVVGEGPAQELDVLRIELGREDVLARRQETGQEPRARADLEHARAR